MSAERPVDAAALLPAAAAATEHDAFNSLIERIRQRRALLAEWEQAIPAFRQKCLTELFPLRDKERQLRAQLALDLDAIHGGKGFSRNERSKLSELIVGLAGGVLRHAEDAEMRRLVNAHSDPDEDAQADEMPPADAPAQDEPRPAHETAKAQAAAHRKAAKAQARADKREAETRQLSQSIREVYRKLVSALHPDREPDPAEQLRKTALMQRVNAAYEKGQLLQLLELQLELEHIDEAHLANLDATRLGTYQRILKGQLAELDSEIQRIEREFIADFGLSAKERLRPDGLLPILKSDVAACRKSLRTLEAMLELAGDARQLRSWLKQL
ncbi:J domain-containing protein [Derxia lacustris]|uniref:J domain-containing protein n=1 Tax=Derxia lacustris TaxID=764842 RepID=UPI00111C0E71|nr:J domain-containing protein [Derxia lacustris]